MGFKPTSRLNTDLYVHEKNPEIEYDDEVVAVIDADLISFKSAAAGESRFIIVTNSGEGIKKRFKSRSEFWGRDRKKSGGWLAAENSSRLPQGKKEMLIGDFTIEDGRDVEDISKIVHTVNVMISSILDACKTSSYKVYLGQGLNFRHKVATVQKYKEGRSEQLKPFHLKAVRDFVAKRFAATLVCEDEDLTNLEADDWLAIEANKGYRDYKETGKCTTIQVSSDKDSYGVQGMFYNWDKMAKPFLVDGYGKLYLDGTGKVAGFGTVWLLLQMTAGDNADFYKPCYLSGKKFADKGAYNLLKDTKTTGEGLKLVVDLYKSWYPEPVTYSHCTTGVETTKDWLGLANEYFSLAYMKTSVGDKWTFTDLLYGHSMLEEKV